MNNLNGNNSTLNLTEKEEGEDDSYFYDIVSKQCPTYLRRVCRGF
jgi:hypothetical protein